MTFCLFITWYNLIDSWSRRSWFIMRPKFTSSLGSAATSVLIYQTRDHVENETIALQTLIMSYRFATQQPLKYYVLKDITSPLPTVIHLILCISALPFFYYALEDETIYLVLPFDLLLNVKNTYVVELVVTFCIDGLHWSYFIFLPVNRYCFNKFNVFAQKLELSWVL